MALEREQQALWGVLIDLARAFPRQQVPKETLQLYARELIDVPPELLSESARRIIRTADWFPTIAEILRAASDVRDERESIASAEDAWVWASALIPEGGPGRGDVPAGMELADAAIRTIGGWEQLGQGQVTDRPWRRKDFLQAYAALLQRRRDRLVDGGPVLDELEPQRLLERSGTMTRIDANAVLGRIAVADRR